MSSSDTHFADKYILESIRAAADISTGSEELFARIRDGASRFHLSGQRADLLRPFTDALANRSVLEVGCGCGALTRFLSECGARVTALDRSPERVRITAERCRDRQGVEVVYANGMRASAGEGRMNGEEVRARMDGGRASEDGMRVSGDEVQASGDGVRVSGDAVRAWAGLPELNKRFEVAVVGEPELAGPAAELVVDNGLVFVAAGSEYRPGLKDLYRQLYAAGCRRVECYYPFPDHYFPSVLLCEQAFCTPGFNVINLLDGLPFERPPVGDSVLLVGSKGVTNGYDPTMLGYAFSSGRKRPFNKTNIFIREAGGAIRVRRRLHLPGRQPRNLPVMQQLQEEPYLPGELYSRRLRALLATPGWTVDTLVAWARPYFHLVRSRAWRSGGEEYLDGAYTDLVPFNLLAAGLGLEAIDLEWSATEEVPLSYVLFRGLYHSLARAGRVQPPAKRTPDHAFGLTLAVIREFLPDTTGILEDFIERELRYFGPILLGDAKPRDFALEIGQEPERNGLPVTGAVTKGPASGGESATKGPASGGRKAMDELTDGPAMGSLLNLNLQFFIETPDAPFDEARSVKRAVGLTGGRQVCTVVLSGLPTDWTRLRIDLSDRPGLLCLHSLRVLGPGGADLLFWTPFSRETPALGGMMILQSAPGLSAPVVVLLDHDPMMIFPLPDPFRNLQEDRVIVELELSAPDDADVNAISSCLKALVP